MAPRTGVVHPINSVSTNEKTHNAIIKSNSFLFIFLRKKIITVINNSIRPHPSIIDKHLNEELGGSFGYGLKSTLFTASGIFSNNLLGDSYIGVV